MTEREKLVEQAAEHMRQNGRIPEYPVLRALPDAKLRELIAYWWYRA
jgi:hypothetical protein